MKTIRSISFALATLLAGTSAGAPRVAAAQTAKIISIDARDIDLSDLIRLLAAESNENIVADGSVKPQRVTLRLRNVRFDEALSTITQSFNLVVHRNGKILVLGDAATMNRRYAESGAFAAQTVVLTLSRAKVDDLVAPLISALPIGTVVFADKRSSSIVITGNETTVERARQLVRALDISGVGANGAQTTAYALQNVKASEAARALRGVIPETAIVADDRQNSILITGNAEVTDTAKQILANIDNPGRQVMFEVRVADVQPEIDSSNLGITFGGKGFGSGGLAQFAYTLTQSSVIVNAQLNALIQRGHASILATPRIATLNNHEANLLVGETYPVVTTNLQTGLPTVQNVDVGVKLRLTPTIGPNGTITAELHPEYSQIIGFNAAFPIVANRRVDSTLRVRDGETIVLGGLFSDVDSDTVTKLPFLGDVPVFGSFFRNRQRSHTKDEVVFLITPHVL